MYIPVRISSRNLLLTSLKKDYVREVCSQEMEEQGIRSIPISVIEHVDEDVVMKK